MNSPKLYQLKDGDIFTLGIEAVTPEILNDKKFRVHNIEKRRPYRFIKIFNKYFYVPSLRKKWIFTFRYVSKEPAEYTKK